MRRGFSLLFTGLTCLVFAGKVNGAVVNVPSEAATISEAMIVAQAGDTVMVEAGTYRENVMLAPGVTLLARSQFQATINGRGKGTVVTMARDNKISGFVIRNGTIGIFSNGAGNEITGNRIVDNWQTGLMVIRHLPKVEDNVIAFNRSSGIQGWDVRSTQASVNHNSIAYNGNHGIALGGASEVIIENNVVAFNERFGLKIIQDEDNVQIISNNFYRNLYSPRPMPDGNFSFDPAFTSPRSKMNFKSNPTLCCQTQSSDNENLGARLNH